jgi:hypothetical protein
MSPRSLDHHPAGADVSSDPGSGEYFFVETLARVLQQR